MLNIIPKPLIQKEYLNFFSLDLPLIITSDFENIKNLILKSFPKILIKPCPEANNFLIVHDELLGKEEYKITVKENSILISASSEKGAYYGFQTLLQLTVGEDNIKVPCCEIIDKPRFLYRGFMMDEARHFFGKEFIKSILDMMAKLKLNTFHWHLTDDQGWRVEIKKYPLLTEKGSIRSSTQLNIISTLFGKAKNDNKTYGEGLFYTQKDIMEIVDYAKEKHINIIPEIDMPGHLISAISCYPELSCAENPIDVSNKWGVMDTIGCCGKKNIYNFVKDVIDELVKLFPYEYFHIGGDEVPKTKWKECPNCQAKIKELLLADEEELQSHFNNIILNYLKTKNKKMMGWNEILKAKNLPDDILVQWWMGGKSKVLPWLERGNKIILSNLNYMYMDHFYAMKDLSKFYSLDLNVLALDEKYESQVLGIEAPQWTEYIKDKRKFDFNTFPRMQALAEICWTAKKNKNFPNFEERLKVFNKKLDKLNINYAPRSEYLCLGIRGKFRKLFSWLQWIINPCYEVETYYKKKSKK